MSCSLSFLHGNRKRGTSPRVVTSQIRVSGQRVTSSKRIPGTGALGSSNEVRKTGKLKTLLGRG